MNTFFKRIYEMFYDQPGFSDDLYNERVYQSTGLWCLIGSLAWVVIFYYIINRPNFSKWWHWLFIGLFNCGINFGLGYCISKSVLVDAAIEYDETTFYVTFALINALLSFLFYFVFSFMLRWWSRNASRTPFPN